MLLSLSKKIVQYFKKSSKSGMTLLRLVKKKEKESIKDKAPRRSKLSLEGPSPNSFQNLSLLEIDTFGDDRTPTSSPTILDSTLQHPYQQNDDIDDITLSEINIEDQKAMHGASKLFSSVSFKSSQDAHPNYNEHHITSKSDLQHKHDELSSAIQTLRNTFRGRLGNSKTIKAYLSITHESVIETIDAHENFWNRPKDKHECRDVMDLRKFIGNKAIFDNVSYTVSQLKNSGTVTIDDAQLSYDDQDTEESQMNNNTEYLEENEREFEFITDDSDRDRVKALRMYKRNATFFNLFLDADFGDRISESTISRAQREDIDRVSLSLSS